MYFANACDTRAPESTHQFAIPHPTPQIDLYTNSPTAGYEMTHPYSGHRQSLFADLSPAISQDDGYMLPQFGEEHIFEHAALVSSGRPAVNAEADALCFHHPSDQLLSPAPSSSPPFAIEYTGRQKPCQRAPPAQNFHNDSWVQANHRVDKRVKLSSPEFTLRPQRHKLRFTAEDDALLMYLKETNSHTWKQIAAYFPGRNPGTLQVRYCTRLKAKSTMWNDENVRKLMDAMQEYENNRWKAIALQVGLGKSAAACKAKALELGIPTTTNIFKSDAPLPNLQMLTPGGT